MFMIYQVMYTLAQTDQLPNPKYWADYGLAGLVIIALMSFIVFIYRSHREERKEWREESKELADQTNTTTNKLTDTVSSLTNAINTLSVQYRDECKYRHDRDDRIT